MRQFEEWCLIFWSAAFYIRRSGDRDHSPAWLAIDTAIADGPMPISDRAYRLSEEMNREQPSRHE